MKYILSLSSFIWALSAIPATSEPTPMEIGSASLLCIVIVDDFIVQRTEAEEFPLEIRNMAYEAAVQHRKNLERTALASGVREAEIGGRVAWMISKSKRAFEEGGDRDFKSSFVNDEIRACLVRHLLDDMFLSQLGY